MYHCPKCDGKTKVTATRVEVRERKCLQCTNVFYTEEVELEERPPLFTVMGKPKRTEYNRNYARTIPRFLINRYQRTHYDKHLRKNWD